MLWVSLSVGALFLGMACTTCWFFLVGYPIRWRFRAEKRVAPDQRAKGATHLKRRPATVSRLAERRPQR